jgi:hypothetical protein
MFPPRTSNLPIEIGPLSCSHTRLNGPTSRHLLVVSTKVRTIVVKKLVLLPRLQTERVSGTMGKWTCGDIALCNPT